MARPKVSGWGFMLGALFLLIVALLPLARRRGLDSTFLVLALVFFVLGAGEMRRRRSTADAPPDA